MTSDWKESGIQRRDFRAIKNGPEVTGKPKKKKDKARWCKGKEGREHVPVTKMGKNRYVNHPVCQDWPWWPLHDTYMCYHVVACDRCGKIIQEWLPREMCPDWPPAGE